MSLVLLLLPLCVMLLLLTGMVGSVGQVAAFPVPSEVTTYSSVADLGTLAQGAAGIVSQVWGTGSRLGDEFLRRAFGFLGVGK
uniref:Putative secreted protein n=2 Tax=Anopheles triannulatus TaxID=58253 RepID=A0A2M3ZZ84_9DIPT